MDDKQRRQFANEVQQRLNTEKAAALNALPQELKTFAGFCSNRYDRPKESLLYRDLRDGLLSGKYKKPSEFFAKKCGKLFDGWILPRYREMFLNTVDRVTDWQYSDSIYRRSFKSRNYSLYLSKITTLLNEFHERVRFGNDYCDVLALRLSPEENCYILERNFNIICPEAIAYGLDHNAKKMQPVIAGILNGESELPISYPVISGIVRSNNREIHEYLGRLLLAARLQEGLRQSICELADCGTTGAFMEILRVINENNLIRFSSVKRAVGTWTGLLTPDGSNLERISAKTLALINDCLSDGKARERYLQSEDCMEIYLALWAYGYHEAEDAMAKFTELSRNGTHHQLLTAGYFAANLDSPVLAAKAAKSVIMRRSEPDILAVYLPYFVPFSYSQNYIDEKIDRQHQKELLDQYFDGDTDEVRKLYARLWEIYAEIPKKSLKFSPCIFPWYSAELTKSLIVLKLGVLSFILCDNSLTDEVCPHISECEEYARISLMKMLLRNPQTEIQRGALVDMLGDKAGYVRDKAFEIVKSVRLDDRNYLQIEDMLRFKAADLRNHLIALLYERPDHDAFYCSVERLLSDKKEEKRTAGLDLVIRLSKDETADQSRAALLKRCRPLAASVQNPSSKEKILIENIVGSGAKADREPLFDGNDVYVPYVPDSGFMEECVALFMDFFPDSEVGNKVYPRKFTKNISDKSHKQALEDIRSLDDLIVAHRTDEFKNSVGTKTLDCESYEFWTTDSDGRRTIPMLNLWQNWYEEKIQTPQRLFRMQIAFSASSDKNDFNLAADNYSDQLFGKGFSQFADADYRSHIRNILSELTGDFISAADLRRLSAAAELWFMRAVPDRDVMIHRKPRYAGYPDHAHLITAHPIEAVLRGSFNPADAHADECFALDNAVYERCINDQRNEVPRWAHRKTILSGSGTVMFRHPSAAAFIHMAYRGVVTGNQLFNRIFGDDMPDYMVVLSGAVVANREGGRDVAHRNRYGSRGFNYAVKQDLLGHTPGRDEPFTESDRKILQYADDLYETVTDEVLGVELSRGDSQTKYTRCVKSIGRIYGIKNFIAVLSALGRETLERSCYYSADTKKGSLSHLLSVCIPSPDDTAAGLGAALKSTDITEKRLIEAAMYSPEWLDMVEEYLGWAGFKSACCYFMAHMNERLDDRRRAMIARYTPLSDEELMGGAFDLDWFSAAYGQLGEKRFNMIYDAAKYISDGSKHSRARKYADAALGKYLPDETAEEIFARRNKDLLMAYSLIPLKEPVEEDLVKRYLNLQRFLKESRQFGSQRSASEKKAVGVALQNLAIRAGYTDTTRLTLRMETKVMEDGRELFAEKQIEDVTVRLDVSDTGKSEIVCIKDGKILKSVPAKLKKNEYILRLADMKKKLTEQYQRTRRMFEQAMEDGTEFTAPEINALLSNPVAEPVVKVLVFAAGKKLGFISGDGLLDYAGKKLPLAADEKIVVAHPFALYNSGNWADFQKCLFEKQIVQPFKQVFRELYIKTDEEAEMTHSLRYAGNQIQPAKTVACLKSRRWVADVEDGLQKVYYRENIVARIYAMADWFSPADIEAPTLEWVEFSDRKTGKELKIKDVPDVIFSEVMRDVDLAVSVAHAGGVDPETSHSTIEMRAALLEFTMPLFKLSNVEISGTHAHIKGKFAEYTLHLGSGVVHKAGGAMIPILPVHSQHRGKLFLPFADDDPKTAEILSKALLLAEDGKIKDPFILEAIRR